MAHSSHLLGDENSELYAGTVGAEFRRKCVFLLYQHYFFIAGNFSKYSSTSNHLPGEYAELFISTFKWLLCPASAHWQEVSQSGLEHESLPQNAHDASNTDQAIWHHQEVAHILLPCSLAGRHNEFKFCLGYWSRLEARLELIVSSVNFGAESPMLGGSDDSVIVELEIERKVYHWLLSTGLVLLGCGEFKTMVTEFDEKAQVQLGFEAKHELDAIAVASRQNHVNRAFPELGYFILEEVFETVDEIRLIADAGTLGYLSIPAHGNADALSCTLSADEHETRVEPGNYSYQTQQTWRDYFKGTFVHNIIRVDRLDHSSSGGIFSWLRHAGAECVEFNTESSEEVWLAQLDGYSVLPDPVNHKRKICLDKSNRVFHIIDSLLCSARHEVEPHWHCSEHCIVRLEDKLFHIEAGDLIVEKSMPGLPWQVEVIEGQLETPLGWTHGVLTPRFNLLLYAGEVPSMAPLTWKHKSKYQGRRTRRT